MKHESIKMKDSMDLHSHVWDSVEFFYTSPKVSDPCLAIPERARSRPRTPPFHAAAVFFQNGIMMYNAFEILLDGNIPNEVHNGYIVIHEIPDFRTFFCRRMC